jgi:hypothetical protein
MDGGGSQEMADRSARGWIPVFAPHFGLLTTFPGRIDFAHHSRFKGHN